MSNIYGRSSSAKNVLTKEIEAENIEFLSHLNGVSPKEFATLKGIKQTDGNDNPITIQEQLDLIGGSSPAITALEEKTQDMVYDNSKTKFEGDVKFNGNVHIASTVQGLNKSHVGLGNVTNESKEIMFTNPVFTGSATKFEGDVKFNGNVDIASSIQGLNKSHVSLGNVTNESKETMFTNPVFTGSAAKATVFKTDDP